MRQILWLLSGLIILIAILLAVFVLILARLNPWLARRLANSGLAAGVLLACYDLAVVAMKKSEG
jgi:hypothetical protein